MIELREVGKRYGDVAAVGGVSLQVEPASITVLVGASGSGKSTLLRLINRLIELDSGQILLDGADIRDGPAEQLRRRIGYVIQSTGLFPHWSVARNIATVPRLLGWPAAEIDGRVDELLELLGLDPAQFRGRYPHQLSGGQQQRVGVARALAARPSVLLMDEPFAALDPLTRQTLQRELLRIQQALQTTVVLVTHDVDEALLLGRQIVLLDQGRVVQAGTPRQLLLEPASERVSSFFGAGALEMRQLEFRSVAEIMQTGEAADGPALRPEDSLQQALTAFLSSRSERLPVADHAGRSLGVVRFVDLLDPPR
ncbi:ABC transporter ATP-binding protein [Piscinibacter sakaiensis]|uniref:ABC transporter ATP-binding protein n=1 Tax=Piscinibacter sakaiensis TaxID=1547922 RepID=UPI003AAE12B4